MPQVPVRNIEPEVLKNLKQRTGGNNRSLEAELRVLMQRAAAEPSGESGDESAERIQADVARIRALFAGRQFDDSTDSIRADRDSR